MPDFFDDLKKNGGMITAAQAQALGISKAVLSKYAKQGRLERIAQGVYILPDAIEDELYLLSLRSQKIVFSHDTALFLWGLSDRTPFTHSVTIPSSASIPSAMRKGCIWYYIKPALYSIGVTERETTFGHRVPCYNAERTVCDLLRSRSRCSQETIVSALKNYASYKTKNLLLLSQYAELFSVTKPLQRYMEVLL